MKGVFNGLFIDSIKNELEELIQICKFKFIGNIQNLNTNLKK